MKIRRWIPPLAIALDWAVIAACISAASVVQNPWLTALAILIIGSRQHALFILVHEGVHYHLASNKWLNEFLSDYLCAFPVLFDTHAYRVNHLRHHRHLNTEQDPDWVRKAGHREWTFPVHPRQMLAYVPFFLFFRGPTEWGQIAYLFSGFTNATRWKTQPLRLIGKAVFYLVAAVTLTHFQAWSQFLVLWLVPLFFVFPALQRIRSISEHFSLPLKNEISSSRNILASPLETFFFSPHNVNYHLVHHMDPQIPFYNLPVWHASHANGGYQNTSFIFPLKGSVLLDLLKGPQMDFAQISNRKRRASA